MTREVRVEADAFVARTTVDGDDGGGIAEDLEVDANRARVALAYRAPQALAGGRELTRGLDFGLRHDGGDGRGGAGVEAGGQLRYHNPARGLTLQARARALLAHSGDAREWGIGGVARLAAGADRQGLAFTVTPGYGDAEFDPRKMWDDGVAHLDGDADFDPPRPAMRMTIDAGYGIAQRIGVLTPYTALRLGDATRDHRLGLRWQARGTGLTLDLSTHRHADTTDDTVTLKGEWRF